MVGSSIWEEVGRYPVLSENDVEDMVVQLKSRIRTTTHFGGSVVVPKSHTMYRLANDGTQVEKLYEEFRTIEPMPRRFRLI